MFIDGPIGPLEAELWTPDEEAETRAAAIVCHPHPQHGGTLDTAVVHRVAKGLRDAGVAALRFNFRGVGRSAGEYHGGFGPGGEEDDALAALEFLAKRFPWTALWAAGFSFGARTVAAAAQRDARVRRVILVALPVRIIDCGAVATLRTPGLIVQAGADEFGDLAELEERFPELSPQLARREIPETDHLFRRRTVELQDLVRRTAESWLEERE